ncbi:SDR family oxidoreductase [Burkholderia multivorans]|nr:SDR family oxidoreductase [Burkholderia multivorans]
MPLGRRGARDDVAQAIASLASPQAAWMRGQRVTDDGGLDARQPP